MILICGIPSESPVEAVIEAAEERGVEFLVLNQREMGYSEICVEVEDGSVGGTLRIREEEVPLHRIGGVYVRLMDDSDLPENQGRSGRHPAPSTLRSGLLHAALVDWLEVAPCRVLNRVSSMASNMSKPYQSQHIQRAGFRVPDTLVTSDPGAVRAFRRKHARVVYKSTSSVRSIVRELQGDEAAALDRIRDLPTQFQEYVPGTNLRVHTVGPRTFCTRATGGSIDYRYASRDGESTTLEPCELPVPVGDRCAALAAALDLPLSGIDLRCTPGGEYYCLEVNPSPAFTYYQEATGQPIASAIVDYLAGRDG